MMASFFSLFFIVVFFKVFAPDVCYWPWGKQPKEIPENCAEVFSPGYDIDGVYTLKVHGLQFEAKCIPDPINGPAWTVIQRRMDGSVDFYRKFEEYEYGFGNKNGEYWLGLRNIFALTNSDIFELWIQLASYDEEYRFARYGKFYLSDASEQYALNAYEYFGNAGDSLAAHYGLKFHTSDKDTSTNCSSSYQGAWWMISGTYYCYWSHLNGKYGRHTKVYKSGIKWATFKGLVEPMKYVHMAVRPLKYSK